MLGIMSFSQTDSTVYLNISGKSTPKMHFRVIVINENANDTIEVLYSEKRFKLDPLHISNDHTIIFKRGGHVKTLYLSELDSKYNSSNYYLKLNINWDNWDTYGFIEYDKITNKYNIYESNALRHE